MQDYTTSYNPGGLIEYEQGRAETWPPICQENINHQKKSRQKPGNLYWVIASIHLSIQLWLWETRVHPFDRKIANVSAGRSVQAVSLDKCELVRSLGIHRPTSVTLSRRLAPFVSSAHATQTYNSNTQPLTSATPLTFPPWSLSCISWRNPSHPNGSVGRGARMEFEKFTCEFALSLSDLQCANEPVLNVSSQID